MAVLSLPQRTEIQGGKIGPGVVLLDGEFGSGGTWKRWHTYGCEGTVFEIEGVPVCKIEDEKKKTGWKIEILECNKINVESLQKEKNRILKRLEKIDQLLQEESA